MKILAAMILIVSILTGCDAADTSVERAAELRKQLLEADACSFQATITADYGDALYTFQMECSSSQAGDLQFTVTDPEVISGISGTISAEEAALVFDDTIVAFPVLADGQITPVIAPWIFLNTLQSGYLKACSDTESGFCIYLDDSFEEDPLQLLITTDASMEPKFAEIYWHEQRIMSLDIRNFLFM